MRKLRRLKFFLLILVFLIFLFLIAFRPEIFYFKKEIVEKKKIEVKNFLIFTQETTRYPSRLVVLSNLTKVGISTETDRIDFGVVPTGVSVKKLISIKNKDPFPVKVYLEAHGSLKEFFEAERRSFILAPLEVRNLTISAIAKRPGNYSGEIDVIVKSPKISWFLWLL